MSSPKKRSDDASTGTIITSTEMTTTITAPGVGGQMMKRGIVGSAENMMRKIGTIGEATMTVVDAQSHQRTPDLQRRRATGDHPRRIVHEEQGLPLPIIIVVLDHHLAGKQTATTSLTAKAFPLTALRLVGILPPPKHNPKRKIEIRLWTSLLG